MDELLPRPRAIYTPAPSRARVSSRKVSAPKFKTAWSFPNFMERRSSVGPAVFLTLALSVSAALILGTFYAPCYQVTVDGIDMGLFSSPAVVEEAVERVEAHAALILGHDYTLSNEITYTRRMSLKEDCTTTDLMEVYLFDQIHDFMQVSYLSVNGQVIGATDDVNGLNNMLDAIKAPYVNENTIFAGFAQPVAVAQAYSSVDTLTEVADMEELLTSNTMEQVDYTVVSGDTFSGIAYRMGLTMQELHVLNPDVDIDRLWVGDVLTVSQAVPYLSVKTVDNITYQGPVDYEIQQVPDDNMYQGNSTVLVDGVEGEAIFNADVTYINGTETQRTINSTQILTEPVTKVVAVGTKPRPRTMATGSFRWPITGKITSGYGRRYIFGSYSNHSGIDIAAPYGSSIAAADGGVVIFAGTGTDSNWSYGKYVVIDHENGLQTYYAHCSSLCVKAGQRVYKGQTIAKVGSTGRSTGNHCHFQVKKNGVTVSPWGYLP